MPMSSPNFSHLVCTLCGRSFSRREHLDRHYLIHSNEKPFVCSVCQKRYARRDVYQRHLRTHDPVVSLPPSKRQKVQIACDGCHDRKMRCHPSERPCPRCKSGGLVCTFRQRPVSSSDPPATPFAAPNSPLMEPDAESVPRNYGGENNLTHLTSPIMTPSLETSPNIEELQPPLVFDASRTDNMSFVGPQQPIYNELFETDPYLMFLNDDLFQSTWEAQDGFFEDLNTVFGATSSDYGLNFGTGSFDPQLHSMRNVLGELPRGVQTLQVDANGGTSEYGNRRQQRLATAYAKLHEYSSTSYPSRPPSPQSGRVYERYLQELGSMEPLTYDSVVINVFIGLFQTYVAPTFPCFQNFRIGPSTPEEVYLAMAATGGLYCNNPGSEKVAQWLYYVARRKLLTLVHSKAANSTGRKMAVLQAYILMEIFAFICGDKRIGNLMEVYHGQVVQGVRDIYAGPSDHTVLESDRQSLIDAVYILECYRVVLLQRSSMLYPFSVGGSLPTIFQGRAINGHATNQDSVLSLLRSLMSNDGSSVKIDSPTLSIQGLCAISLLTSHTRRLPGSLSLNLQPTDGLKYSSTCGWRQETIELTLQKWLHSHLVIPPPSTLILYHTIHLTMYSNFSRIENLARWVLTQKVRTGNDRWSLSSKHGEASQEEGGLTSSQPPAFQRCFNTEEDQEKAIWHANRILQIAKDIKMDTSCPQGGRVHLLRQAESVEFGEFTHYSHSVYEASIVLWWPSAFSKLSFTGDESEKEPPRQAAENLRRGIDLLSRSASQVAAVFKQILESLESRL